MKIWKMEREGLFRNFLTIIMVGNCCWHQCIGMVSFSSFGCTLLSVNFLFLFDNFLFSTAVRCLNLEYTVAYSQCCETKIQLFFFASLSYRYWQYNSTKDYWYGIIRKRFFCEVCKQKKKKTIFFWILFMTMYKEKRQKKKFLCWYCCCCCCICTKIDVVYNKWRREMYAYIYQNKKKLLIKTKTRKKNETT